MNRPKKRKRLLAPREEIAWFPMIEASHCNGCGDCQAFCRPGVFSPGTPDPSGIYKAKMSVANPFNCIVLCTRCEHVCPSGAITLPHPQDFKHFVEEYLD